MQIKISTILSMFAILTLIFNTSWAQVDTTPKKRLYSPATITGFIGGESHDGYVIHARKGQVLTVRISWKLEGDNIASFTVSESPNFYTSQPVKFGEIFNVGKRWMGKIPKTGAYYIWVVAHPIAHYTLRVRVR